VQGAEGCVKGGEGCVQGGQGCVQEGEGCVQGALLNLVKKCEHKRLLAKCEEKKKRTLAIGRRIDAEEVGGVFNAGGDAEERNKV
jgi:hypothetical protein